ncbi:PRC-barrel domain-containing protein [Virgibacillus kimchii]
MFAFTSDLKTYNIEATDGGMGKVQDLYFDDHKWAVRYAIVDTRKWLPGRKVLLSPGSFKEIDDQDKIMYVGYDKETVRNSPPVPENKAFTRDTENTLIGYYGWSRYWMGSMLWGPEDRPLATFNTQPEPRKVNEENAVPSEERQSELRSEGELIDCRVHGDDGKLGQVKDIVFDTEYWKLRYLVIQNSENFTEEEYILCPSTDIETVDWNERDVYVKGTTSVRKKKFYYNRDEILENI